MGLYGDFATAVATVEDELAACASAIGASFAGALGVTSTSGPGICLKSEAINLAVMDELPLVVIDVQRGGPSTGLPTKAEQTDLLQVLYGRNGESPMPVIAPKSPIDCFTAAFWACKIAVEHVTPVVLLTDAFIANGSAAWRLPIKGELGQIHPHVVTSQMKDRYTPYERDPATLARYWAVPGIEGYEHILGGLEKDEHTGAISNNPENHDIMVHERRDKVERIEVPNLRVEGDEDDAEHRPQRIGNLLRQIQCRHILQGRLTDVCQHRAVHEQDRCHQRCRADNGAPYGFLYCMRRASKRCVVFGTSAQVIRYVQKP